MDIIDYLPQKMKAEAEAYMPCGLEEIRVRAGKQVQYMFAGGCRAGVYISHSDIEEMINYLSGYSFHAIAPQLAAGYLQWREVIVWELQGRWAAMEERLQQSVR